MYVMESLENFMYSKHRVKDYKSVRKVEDKFSTVNDTSKCKKDRWNDQISMVNRIGFGVSTNISVAPSSNALDVLTSTPNSSAWKGN